MPANIFHPFWETFPVCLSKSEHLSFVPQLGQVHGSIIVIDHSITIIYIHIHLSGAEIKCMGTGMPMQATDKLYITGAISSPLQVSGSQSTAKG